MEFQKIIEQFTTKKYSNALFRGRDFHDSIMIMETIYRLYANNSKLREGTGLYASKFIRETLRDTSIDKRARAYLAFRILKGDEPWMGYAKADWSRHLILFMNKDCNCDSDVEKLLDEFDESNFFKVLRGKDWNTVNMEFLCDELEKATGKVKRKFTFEKENKEDRPYQYGFDDLSFHKEIALKQPVVKKCEVDGMFNFSVMIIKNAMMNGDIIKFILGLTFHDEILCMKAISSILLNCIRNDEKRNLKKVVKCINDIAKCSKIDSRIVYFLFSHICNNAKSFKVNLELVSDHLGRGEFNNFISSFVREGHQKTVNFITKMAKAKNGLKEEYIALLEEEDYDESVFEEKDSSPDAPPELA